MMSFYKKIILPVLGMSFLCVLVVAQAAEFPVGQIDSTLIPGSYQGNEKLVYRLSWSGGVKIGKLTMEVSKKEGLENGFELRAKVKDSGIFHFFYPVDDTFVTIVQGEERLPVSYTVQQKEGRSYTANRHTDYYQEAGKIEYQKNKQDVETFQVDGTVHNEFSSFFITRILQLEEGRPVIVPTFADGERHEVAVYTGKKSRLSKTILGAVNVIPVKPVMKFKGLYDKDGDTVIWLTDDLCRVPVKITSKILIGSLVADLVSYSNPDCGDQSQFHKMIPEEFLQESSLGTGD